MVSRVLRTNGVHLRRSHESLRKGEWVAFDEAASHDANVRGSVRRRELQINGRLVKEPTECPSERSPHLKPFQSPFPYPP
jgi:hypothetical protein